MFDQFPEYYMNIQLRDFNTKLKREHFQTNWEWELYAQSNESGIGVVNFGPKNLSQAQRSQHQNTPTYTSTS